MTIEFEYETVREDHEGADQAVTLYIECDVSKSYEEEGLRYFATVLSATDWDGNAVDLNRREQREVEDIAIDIFTGD
jgi:hypothetical protein